MESSNGIHVGDGKTIFRTLEKKLNCTLCISLICLFHVCVQRSFVVKCVNIVMQMCQSLETLARLSI